MKSYFLAILLFTILSCSENSDLPVVLDTLNVESLEPYVPISYLETHSNVVFKNEQSAEIEFEIIRSTSLETSTLGDLEYDREIKSYMLENKNGLNFSLEILMSAHYYDQSTIVKSVSCYLRKDGNNSWIPAILLDGKGETLIGQSETMTWGQRTFDDVFSSITPPTNQHEYTQIFYNYEWGFVGFLGAENERWYLDGYRD
ncbi:MAG: hypothetical protein GVX78_01690 [Bacteroidetes bacterium]|jgi:hypothetical protein|nr:hypothetical protein [Bacteroidota bacterium]